MSDIIEESLNQDQPNPVSLEGTKQFYNKWRIVFLKYIKIIKK